MSSSVSGSAGGSGRVSGSAAVPGRPARRAGEGYARGEMSMRDAWIALGANLGDREDALARAVDLLREHGIEPVRASNLYETVPEGGKPEPLYLNAVLQARTDLGAEAVLATLHGVEQALGREETRRAGPRTCDLDLLSLGDLVLDGRSGPVLPHPRMHVRSFVLVPLCELDVHWNHPALRRSAGELLAELPSVPGEVRLHGPLPHPAGAR